MQDNGDLVWKSWAHKVLYLSTAMGILLLNFQQLTSAVEFIYRVYLYRSIIILSSSITMAFVVYMKVTLYPAHLTAVVVK